MVAAETTETSQADAYARFRDAGSKWKGHDENHPVDC